MSLDVYSDSGVLCYGVRERSIERAEGARSRERVDREFLRTGMSEVHKHISGTPRIEESISLISFVGLLK